MTFTAHPTHTEKSCHGMNHSDRGTLGSCDSCGARVVRAAKGQLCTLYPVPGRDAEFFYCWAYHRCSDRAAALKPIVDAEQVLKGEFPKHTPVEVVKGRKVPVGTKGIVMWVGDDEFNRDAYRLGLKVEGEAKLVYVTSANVKVDADHLAAATAVVAEYQAQWKAAADRLAYLEAQVEEDELLRELIWDEYMGSGLKDGDDKDAKFAFYADHIEPVRARQQAAFAEIKAIKEERGY